MDPALPRDRPTGTRDRRLGERYVTAPLIVGWTLDRGGRFRRSPTRQGELVDVSLTGAAVVAPSDDRLTVRTRVRVDWDGGTATVVIRRVGPGPVPHTSTYGVAFHEMDHEFRERLFAEIGAHRPDSVQALRPTDDPHAG